MILKPKIGLISSLVILLLLASFSGFGQRKNSYGQNIKMYKSDRLLLSANYLQWTNLPNEIDLENINRGFHMALYFDNPLGGSRFSLAYGLSLSTVNLFSDAVPTYLLDTNCAGTQFIKIKDICQNSGNYKQNKMAFTYVSIPVELRLRLGKDEKFKLSTGFEFGILSSSFVKYQGDNFFLKSRDEIRIKYYRIENASLWRYGASFRIGYSRFSLRVFYPLVSTFNKKSNQTLFPIELGLSLMVF